MNRPSILIVLYPGCISFEVALAAELLSAKYAIVCASPDGADLPAETSGLPLKTHVRYSDVNLGNCAGILVPGGNPDSLVGNTEIDRLLQGARERDLWIGAICAGPSLLGKAGILKGRRIAHGYGPEQLDYLKEIFAGVTLTDEVFVADGKILTAKPEAHIEFAVEFACRLDAVEPARTGRLKDYYRGTLDRRIRPLALARLENACGELLVNKAVDSVKNETFYRPLGGGIEFGETGETAIVREIREELSLEVKATQLLNVVENIFVYEGRRGHEVVMIYAAEFTDRSNYERESFPIVESGGVVGVAVWRTPTQIQAEGAKLYPDGFK